jgi:hypothetical protein
MRCGRGILSIAANKAGSPGARNPWGGALSKQVVLKESNRQRYADFNASNAVLEFATPVSLGSKYALAAWVSFPQNRTPSMLFHGATWDFVNVRGSGVFGAWVNNKANNYSDSPVPATGWHHVAMSADGKQSTLYLDGKLFGVLPFAIEDNLATVGNHVENYEQGKMMAVGMDDVVIFSRDLTAAEVATLVPVRVATTMSSGR